MCYDRQPKGALARAAACYAAFSSSSNLTASGCLGNYNTQPSVGLPVLEEDLGPVVSHVCNVADSARVTVSLSAARPAALPEPKRNSIHS